MKCKPSACVKVKIIIFSFRVLAKTHFIERKRGFMSRKRHFMGDSPFHATKWRSPTSRRAMTKKEKTTKSAPRFPFFGNNATRPFLFLFLILFDVPPFVHLFYADILLKNFTYKDVGSIRQTEILVL